MRNCPRLFAVLLLALFLFPNRTKAEEIFTPLEKSSITGLTWDDCVKEAKQNHPDLRAAQEKLNQAEADKAIAESNFLPRISSGLSGRTSKTTATDRTNAYSYDITGRQLLFDGFKTS